MILAFALYKYFPFGGLQRDFLRIALECQKRGHKILVFTTAWQGERPDGFDIRLLDVSGHSNHVRMQSFQRQVGKALANRAEVTLVGFNKMPGLDVYYAADTCYKEKALNDRAWWYRLTPRYKGYYCLEESVFSSNSKALILALTQHQIEIFHRFYGTPKKRFRLLPPGIEKNTLVENRALIRQHYRNELAIDQTQRVMLLVGSSFKTKGLDRAINTLASLPSNLLDKTTLLVLGDDCSKHFEKQAKNLGCINNIHFLGGRNDVQQLMLSADLLIHPAYTESAGMVLLEAIAAGLPVLTTDICGYAPYISDSESGIVASTPFNQTKFNKLAIKMLTSEQWAEWHKNALKFAEETDLYSQHAKAADYIIDLAKKRAAHT
ncbi:glycosyltransferase family 4 protein [Endozoicomonas sp. 4G]|uniref:glycosyltransferase family 4 protein n=1 Tax=Endozoicomonas sp. 4G TaxID=2872754 RepID=UPI00207889EB|nr:glycosyltransferase family 4 protein [Endozoicomonas sp. 4G]